MMVSQAYWRRAADVLAPARVEHNNCARNSTHVCTREQQFKFALCMSGAQTMKGWTIYQRPPKCMHHINYPLLVHRLHLVTRNTPQIVNQIHIAHIVYLTRRQMAGGGKNALNKHNNNNWEPIVIWFLTLLQLIWHITFIVYLTHRQMAGRDENAYCNHSLQRMHIVIILNRECMQSISSCQQIYELGQRKVSGSKSLRR